MPFYPPVLRHRPNIDVLLYGGAAALQLSVVVSGCGASGSHDIGEADASAELGRSISARSSADGGAPELACPDARGNTFSSYSETCEHVDCSTAETAPDANTDGVHCGLGGVCEQGRCREACDLGVVLSPADVSLLGQISYFAEGRQLATGRYLVEYRDGCMKYSSWQWWALQARLDGTATWWLVGADTADKKAVLPGTEGFYPKPEGISDAKPGFKNFEDCVAANRKEPPLVYAHPGGPLGVWLKDSPYTDNIVGKEGRNPSWTLTKVGSCSPL